MKQEEKRCSTCLYWHRYIGPLRHEGDCRYDPPRNEGPSDKPEFVHPTTNQYHWCGLGRWRDEFGRLIEWHDPEPADKLFVRLKPPPLPGLGIVEDAIKEINDHLDKLPTPIHWIRIEDEKPTERERYFVTWVDNGQREYGTDTWIGNRFAQDDDIDTPTTHWAHITPPED